ncbi:MAG: alpha/beta hydrolase [Burkholderiaceae bacterium]
MTAVPQSEPAFADVNGVSLCYDTFGDRKDSPLLLIMGLGAQMIAWDPDFCRQLAERGHFVVRFDNRDIGLSTKLASAGVPDIQALVMATLQGKPVTAPYTLDDMAADTAALIDALDLGPSHVVGASMGGMIAQQLAVRQPDKVRTLTSIMSSTGNPNLPPAKPEALAALMTPAPIELDAFLANYQKVWNVLRGSEFPEEAARDLERGREAFRRGLNPAGVARQMAAIFASGNRKAGLAAIKAPTLVIHGDIDPLVPVEGGIDTADAIPGARLVRVPRMGHALPVGVWPEVIGAIAEHTR